MWCLTESTIVIKILPYIFLPPPLGEKQKRSQEHSSAAFLLIKYLHLFNFCVMIITLHNYNIILDALDTHGHFLSVLIFLYFSLMVNIV